MVKPPKIAAASVKDDPRIIWITFADFIMHADTREMNDIQMAAQLPFWYDSEIRSNGHLHYFENGYIRLENSLNVLILATLDALKIIKADRQAEILGEASDLYFGQPRRHVKDLQKLKFLAKNNEFIQFDKQYCQASPGIELLLEKYVMDHLENFVTVV